MNDVSVFLFVNTRTCVSNVLEQPRVGDSGRLPNHILAFLDAVTCYDTVYTLEKHTCATIISIFT